MPELETYQNLGVLELLFFSAAPQTLSVFATIHVGSGPDPWVLALVGPWVVPRSLPAPVDVLRGQAH
jgi:hypothetical protein